MINIYGLTKQHFTEIENNTIYIFTDKGRVNQSRNYKLTKDDESNVSDLMVWGFQTIVTMCQHNAHYTPTGNYSYFTSSEFESLAPLYVAERERTLKPGKKITGSPDRSMNSNILQKLFQLKYFVKTVLMKDGSITLTEGQVKKRQVKAPIKKTTIKKRQRNSYDEIIPTKVAKAKKTATIVPDIMPVQVKMSGVPIPNDVLQLLFTTYSRKEILPLRLVCKTWNKVITDPKRPSGKHWGYIDHDHDDPTKQQTFDAYFKDVVKDTYVKYINQETNAYAIRSQAEEDEADAEEHLQWLKHITKKRKYEFESPDENDEGDIDFDLQYIALERRTRKFTKYFRDNLIPDDDLDYEYIAKVNYDDVVICPPSPERVQLIEETVVETIPIIPPPPMEDDQVSVETTLALLKVQEETDRLAVGFETMK